MSEHEGRLERLENRIDELKDAVVALARVEERQTQAYESIKLLWDEVRKLHEAMNAIHQTTQRNKIFVGMYERLAWAVATGVIGYAAYAARGLIG